jgi:hypothetical protein
VILARLFVTGPLLHMLYAMFFLPLADAAGKAVDTGMDEPDFIEFHRRMLAGQVNLADLEAKLQYSLVHFKRFRETLDTPRLQDALQ